MNACVGEKITVCLLAYNHVHVIESTLNSILKQTIAGYEVFVSDDCSTDGTWERILELAAKDPRIKPTQTPHNMGMPGNANFAVAQSSRPYIALLHHDDLYRTDLLEKWVSVMERFPDTTFVFNRYDDPDAEHHYGKTFNCEWIEGQYFFEKHLLKRWGCPVRGTAMIRRLAWDALGGMREEFGLLADVDMWMRLSRYGPVGYVSQPVIRPRHHRPDYYPDIYTHRKWNWKRHVYLLEIHARNHLEHYSRKTILGQLKWLKFRTRLSLRTAKWLVYAMAKGKINMIATSEESATEHDLLPLRLLRITVRMAQSVVGRL